MTVNVRYNDIPVRIMDGQYIVNGKPIAKAIDDYRALIEHIDDFRRFAAEGLLELYNDVWQDEDIGEIDQQGFIKKLVNPSLVLFDELGAANVYFGDGGLFAGHTIVVSIEKGKATSVDIAG